MNHPRPLSLPGVPAAPEPPTLLSLALLFLRLGAIGFGGGMAVVALLEAELIQRRKLMEPEEFLHGVALSQILGPFAVNTSFFVGYRRFGLLGGLACAGAFLAPSVALVILLAWLYFSFHTLPSLQTALLGLGPVVIALILSAAWSMGRKAVHSWAAGFLTALALVMAVSRVNSLAALAAGAGVGLWAGKEVLSGKKRLKATEGGRLSALALLGGAPAAAAPLVATAALFAPALVLMGLLSHFYGRLKDLRQAQNLLAGLTPVVVGLILGAAVLLAPGAIQHWQGVVLFALALLILLRWRWHPAFVLGLGALAGASGFVR